MLYCNKTRYAAIVTLRIDSVEEGEVAAMLGQPDAFVPLVIGTGHFDILVDPNQELHLGNAQGQLVQVRNAP